MGAGFVQAQVPPLQGALNHPREDTLVLGLKLLHKALITLGLRDHHVERHELDAPPDSVVGAADLRAVVGDDDGLVGWIKLPEVLLHVPRAYSLAAGHLLYKACGEPPSVPDLDARNEADAERSV